MTTQLRSNSNLDHCCTYNHAPSITLNFNPPMGWWIKQIRDVLRLRDDTTHAYKNAIAPLGSTHDEVIRMLPKKSCISPIVLLAIILHHMLSLEHVQVSRTRSQHAFSRYTFIDALIILYTFIILKNQYI